MVLTMIFYTFLVFTAIQILYYLYFSSIFLKKINQGILSDGKPLSIIIFAKNSGDLLKKNLQYILDQEYPKFEVVLINNYSTDNTTEVINNLKKNNKNISIIDVKNTEAFWGSKKYALTLGIKAAKYNHLIFTSANSRPISKNWLTEMSKTFRDKKTIILGYQKFKVKNNLTNIFIRFHNLLLALHNFSFIKTSTPYMAFDANFGYERKTFLKVKGFVNHIKIYNGENDLFLKDAANSGNVNYTVVNDSLVEIDLSTSFRDWFIEQRNKHILQKQYKFKHRFAISLFWVSKMIFFGLGILLLFIYPWKIILSILIAYFLISYIVVGFSAKKLKEPHIIFFLPFLEIGLLLIQFTIFIANLFAKPKI